MGAGGYVPDERLTWAWLHMPLRRRSRWGASGDTSQPESERKHKGRYTHLKSHYKWNSGKLSRNKMIWHEMLYHRFQKLEMADLKT
jgi:hypothetical protein